MKIKEFCSSEGKHVESKLVQDVTRHDSSNLCVKMHLIILDIVYQHANFLLGDSFIRDEDFKRIFLLILSWIRQKINVEKKSQWNRKNNFSFRSNEWKGNVLIIEQCAKWVSKEFKHDHSDLSRRFEKTRGFFYSVACSTSDRWKTIID